MAQEGLQTIEEWIRGKVSFTLTDNNVNTILVDRDVAPGTDAALVELRTRELCWADTLTLFLSLENNSVKDGGSSESRSVNHSRDEAERLAMWLYQKWEEDVPDLKDNNVKDITEMW